MLYGADIRGSSGKRRFAILEGECWIDRESSGCEFRDARLVEKFIRAVGTPDPFAVTVRTGNRIILVAPPKTPDDAVELVRRYVGQAMVRVGVTQYPAGLGVTDVSEFKSDLVDTCANIRMGTALFGKVYRIVMKWYGAPVDEAFGDAIDAWKSGAFRRERCIRRARSRQPASPQGGIGRWRQAQG
ncbi:hypothetical protein [Bradyrhizobium sp. USDA 10063]